jgi:hypothetical protein
MFHMRNLPSVRFCIGNIEGVRESVMTEHYWLPEKIPELCDHDTDATERARMVWRRYAVSQKADDYSDMAEYFVRHALIDAYACQRK